MQTADNPQNKDTQTVDHNELNQEPASTAESSDPSEGEVTRADSVQESVEPVAPPQEPKQDSDTPANQDGVPLQSYFLVKRQNLATPFLKTQSEDPFNGKEEVLSLPPTFNEAMENIFKNLDNQSISGDPAWVANLAGAQKTLYTEGEVTPALSRENSLWTQNPTVDQGSPMRGSQLLIQAEAGQALQGDRAVLAALSHFDMGTIFQVPLWNSGFWLRLRAPGNSAIIEFIRRYTQEKIRIGRSTYGMAFSSHMVYTIEVFMEFIEDAYYNSSLPEKPKDLASVINIHDFMTLVWGLACATYPSGFNYRRSCVNSPSKCNHVVEERINVSRLMWVDQKALNEDQLRHMRRSSKASMTYEQVKKYQEDLAIRFKRTRTIKDHKGRTAEITFRVPTIRECIESGSVWINSISSSVIDALGVDSSADARNEYMNDLAAATSSRQSLHWVESISFNGAPVTKREALEKIFDSVISVNDELREQFAKHVLDFNNESLISVLGIPNYTCPACKGHQHRVEGEKDDEVIPTVIPIEGVTTFFDLLFQKIELIRERD